MTATNLEIAISELVEIHDLVAELENGHLDGECKTECCIAQLVIPELELSSLRFAAR